MTTAPQHHRTTSVQTIPCITEPSLLWQRIDHNTLPSTRVHSFPPLHLPTRSWCPEKRDLPSTNNRLKFLPGAHTRHNLSFPECVNEEFFPGTHIRGGTTPSLGDAKLCSERLSFYNVEEANDRVPDDSVGRTNTLP